MIDQIKYILPIIIAVETLGAGVVMLFARQWGSAVYWLSACAITIGVILIPTHG
jgi:hypothetical protein